MNEPLNSIAFQIGSLPVHWYGIILGTAVLAGLLLSIRESKKHGMSSDVFLDLVLFGVPAGVIGGRIYYVLFEWEFYVNNPGQIFAIWNGGLAIHGALIAAVITAIIFCKKRNLPFWRVADIAAPQIILAQAIGRWGNFMNQEAHGGPVDRGFLENLQLPEFIINQMYIYNSNPGGGLQPGYYYHQPTFLYESLWNLLGFFVLVGLRKLNLRLGELFFSYVIWYSAGRFFIEGLRTDSLMLTDSLRVAQVISLVLIGIAVTAIIVRRKKGQTELYYNPNYVPAVSGSEQATTQAKKPKKKKKSGKK
ncbi:phosphatidylglycerol:prolipoprotein diacylglycerol transferase [Bacillus horti]|uniref:Phosphatidylglycerol--prolipoprotein diacylglyceryl transferase n=2 Tax=Caldalkalibacillus horti TaxID=77523 RepID=A0ABT9W5C5_9BACI|nr:prolipoprotein diacylglyceryl transferase [Bacillus horti]MDQ0168431.1 phosphatidylglycerol:prolipoprotein diacylglycerol transferase [Bacillus horti]